MHKDSIFACILHENGEKTEHVYGVLTPELESLRDDLLAMCVEEVSLESTSIYWVPILRVLEPHFEMRLANPLFIKQMPGRKSDQADAHWIAELTRYGYIKKSFVPTAVVQELRLYERRYVDLRKKTGRIAVQTDNLMQQCNIRISNYLSNASKSKSFEKVMGLLLEGVTDPDELVKCIHGRITKKHGIETIRASLSGVVRAADLRLLRLYKKERDLYEGQKEECLAYMKELVAANYSQEYELLKTIPGMKDINALCVLAEVGADMSAFETASKLVGWAGLKPRNDESNKKVKSRKILKGNKYIRIALTQTAWPAVRTKDSRFCYKYQQMLGRHMKEQKALVAVARKILVVTWHVLSKKEPYDPVRHLKRPRMIEKAQ